MKSKEDFGDNDDSSEESENVEERKMYKATCSDCGAECEVPFEPTEGKPVRCKECFMKNRPKRRFGGSGGRNFGGGRQSFNRNSDRGPREMHDAKCGKCGKQCQVPFKPNNQKPVLCMDCYKKSKGFD